MGSRSRRATSFEYDIPVAGGITFDATDFGRMKDLFRRLFRRRRARVGRLRGEAGRIHSRNIICIEDRKEPTSSVKGFRGCRGFVWDYTDFAILAAVEHDPGGPAGLSNLVPREYLFPSVADGDCI